LFSYEFIRNAFPIEQSAQVFSSTKDPTLRERISAHMLQQVAAICICLVNVT